VNARILLTTIILLPLISGCSFLPKWGTDVKPLEVKTVAVDKTPLNLPELTPLQSKEVQWVIITPDNAEQVWNKLREKKVDLVLIGLTDDGYETLAVTMAELRNYIAQQRAVIVKYKEYYEPAKKPEKSK
jgi:hypothetical protein